MTRLRAVGLASRALTARLNPHGNNTVQSARTRCSGQLVIKACWARPTDTVSGGKNAWSRRNQANLDVQDRGTWGMSTRDYFPRLIAVRVLWAAE